jgi:hypothetical protein
MAVKFSTLRGEIQITEINSGLAPTPTPPFNNDGELKLKNNSYYFDGTKKMQFSKWNPAGYTQNISTVLSGPFTIGLAFAPDDAYSLGMMLGLEDTTSELSFEKGESGTNLSIKLDGKVAKDAVLSDGGGAPTGGGSTGFEFTPNMLNIIFIQRDGGNRIRIRNENGVTVFSIDPDANTAGNFSLNRLGGNSQRYFKGYMCEILIEQRDLTPFQLRNIASSWIDKYFYLPT